MWHDLEHELTQAEAINAAHIQVMKDDRSTITVGEGVRDPRGLYGTTQGLLEEFGPERVVNMPVSESGVMGICTGAAMLGIRPIVVFQNMDYALLALSQLVTHTVRFSLLNKTLPIVIRIVIGQNWINGPQSFQTLHGLLAQIVGLKVVMPVSAKDAKGMLIQAFDDPGPVVILEHCWLYSYKGLVPAERYTLPLDKANIIRSGAHITVAAFSFSVLQAVRAANVLTLQGIEIEIIDMRAARPLDINTVLGSVRRTGRLIVVDSGVMDNTVAAELITQICELGFNLLTKAPVRISSTRQPVPLETSLRDERIVENDSMEIAKASLGLLNRNNKVSYERLAELLYYDQRLDPNVIRV